MTEKSQETQKTLSDELTSVLEEIAEETQTPAEKKKGETVTVLDAENVLIGQRHYRLVKDYREGFDSEKLGERYSEVLSRYDYIVGDWGYEQLRLKGFFREDDRKAMPDQRIDTLEDYLYEFCNFGCAYFVIERVGGKKEKPQNRRKRKRNPAPKEKTAHIEEKKGPVAKPTGKKKPVIKNRQEKSAPVNQQKKENDGKGYVIRKREDS